MREAWFIRSAKGAEAVGPWARDCAMRAGWSAPEAARLGDCTQRSVRNTFETVYRKTSEAGLLVNLDVDDKGVSLELIHEGGASPVEIDAFLTEARAEVDRDRQAEVINLRCRR